jgi:hypothetical protein
MLELFNPSTRNPKRIGGVLARLLRSHSALITKILTKHGVFEDVKLGDVSVRLIGHNIDATTREEFISMGPTPDLHVPDLYSMEYGAYSELCRKNLGSNWFVV